jgi:hypothetical protein
MSQEGADPLCFMDAGQSPRAALHAALIMHGVLIPPNEVGETNRTSAIILR